MGQGHRAPLRQRHRTWCTVHTHTHIHLLPTPPTPHHKHTHALAQTTTPMKRKRMNVATHAVACREGGNSIGLRWRWRCRWSRRGSPSSSVWPSRDGAAPPYAMDPFASPRVPLPHRCGQTPAQLLCVTMSRAPMARTGSETRRGCQSPRTSQVRTWSRAPRTDDTGLRRGGRKGSLAHTCLLVVGVPHFPRALRAHFLPAPTQPPRSGGFWTTTPRRGRGWLPALLPSALWTRGWCGS